MIRASATPRRHAPGHHYLPGYLPSDARDALCEWLTKIHPIWERRYPTDRPLPKGREQRRLLRPVYWLGSWQFACLDYYHPPRGIKDRCVQAESFPPVLFKLVRDIEVRTRRLFSKTEIPKDFGFNTCLINFYGSRAEAGRWIDSARVGEHRDYEPGPVASLSIGERALFQFVRLRAPTPEGPILSQWLDDGSLQIFGGSFYKEHALHRVQRVDRRTGLELPPAIEGFRTRRINFTFRFVPPEHISPFEQLGVGAQNAVREYVEQLARHAPFFDTALERSRGQRPSPQSCLPERRRG